MSYKVENTKAGRWLIYKKKKGDGPFGWLFRSWVFVASWNTEDQMKTWINEDIKEDTIMTTRYFDSRGREDMFW